MTHQVEELVATTLRKRRKPIADATSKHNAILYKLREFGRMVTEDGGRHIFEPIRYGENQNFQWYRGRDALNVAGQEVMTGAEFPWKQFACGVSMAGDEILMNSGQSAIISMMKQRIKNAEDTIMNQKASACYGDGSAFAGRAFGGLELINGSGVGATVGGLNATLNPYWANTVRSNGGAPTTANIYPNMLSLYLLCTIGSEQPNLMMSDNSYYQVYSTSLQAQQRFMNAKMANAGFQSLMFEGTPICFDGGQDGFAPVGMHYLNMKMLSLTMHKKRNNVVLKGAAKRPITEDSETVIIGGMGNFTVRSRRHLGRLVN